MNERNRTLTMPGYLPRVEDRSVKSALRRRGAVLIEGARGCGKTWLARHFARSEARLDDEATLLLASSDPAEVLKGPTPRLLDEWQYAPQMWNRVRRECDDRTQPGQFIFTGSSTPQDDTTRHTGTGRVSRVLLRPMSLFETSESRGTVSLRKLLAGETVSSQPNDAMGLQQIASAICRGGWPPHLNQSEGDALASARDYVNEIIRVDIRSAIEVRHNPTMLRQLMLTLARNTAMETKITKLATEMRSGDPPSRNTVATYLNTLRRIFIVEDQPAWSVSLRSKATLRREAKRHFVDPSIAAAMLRASPQRLLADHASFGLLFESLAIRDLRIYGDAGGCELFHYRDNSGLEADAIVERIDGTWIAVEVKLNTNPQVIDAAAKTLLRLKDKVARHRADDLVAMLILTPTGPAYRRPDGVQVAPLTLLAP